MEEKLRLSLISEILKEIRNVKQKPERIESFIGIEELTEEDLRAIRKSEEEIRKGKYVTASQLKRKLGMNDWIYFNLF
jgi:low affinity Fe/Cu permease